MVISREGMGEGAGWGLGNHMANELSCLCNKIPIKKPGWVAGWLEHCPIRQRAVGLIFRFNPGLGHVQKATDPCFSLSLSSLYKNQWTNPQVRTEKTKILDTETQQRFLVGKHSSVGREAHPDPTGAWQGNAVSSASPDLTLGVSSLGQSQFVSLIIKQ